MNQRPRPRPPPITPAQALAFYLFLAGALILVTGITLGVLT